MRISPLLILFAVISLSGNPGPLTLGLLVITAFYACVALGYLLLYCWAFVVTSYLRRYP